MKRVGQALETRLWSLAPECYTVELMNGYPGATADPSHSHLLANKMMWAISEAEIPSI